MTLFYGAAFNVSVLSLGTLSLTRSGQPTIVLTIAAMSDTAMGGSGTSSIYFHGPYNPLIANERVIGQDPSSTTRLTNYANRSFPWALEMALTAKATAAAWPSPGDIAVSRSDTTGFYTISIDGGSYSVGVEFSVAAGAALLGFSSLTMTAATTHTGTIMPTYLISPTLQQTSIAGSGENVNYEPRGIASRGSTDNGASFGTSRTVSPLWRDWRQEFETKEKTLRLSATSSHPWTFQHLYEHCRCHLAFQVIDTTGQELVALSEAFTFRSDSSQFDSHHRATPGNDSQWHIDFQTVVEGSFQGYTP